MEKIMYNGRDITRNIERKESDIIALYAEKNNISKEDVIKIYADSKLKNVIRDVDNELWTESVYYIVENYSELMVKCATQYVAKELVYVQPRRVNRVEFITDDMIPISKAPWRTIKVGNKVAAHFSTSPNVVTGKRTLKARRKPSSPSSVAAKKRG